MKKTFLICPVRGKEDYAKHICEKLEREGYIVHFPPRDTDQNDDIGLRICQDNRKAIREADCVHFVWDGKSQGALFDLGIAFEAEKKIIPVELPELTDHKSFQNMVTEWAKRV